MKSRDTADVSISQLLAAVYSVLQYVMPLFLSLGSFTGEDEREEGVGVTYGSVLEARGVSLGSCGGYDSSCCEG